MNREEFLNDSRWNGEKIIREYKKENPTSRAFSSRKSNGGFDYWIIPEYPDVYKAIHIKKEKNPLKKFDKKKIGDLDDTYLIGIPKGLIDIQEATYDTEVYIVKDEPNVKKKETVYLNILLNRRFVFKQLLDNLSASKQLNFELQETTNRELWYNVNTELKTKYGLKGEAGDILDKKTSFHEKLMPYLGLEYWGFVDDYLKIDVGKRALIWNPSDFETIDESKVMTLLGLDKYEDCKFFLIICEKEASLRPIMKEMVKRGYRDGYYGISMQGYGTTVVIKLLLRLRKIRNFRIFVLHDLDQSGLQIYLNIKKHIKCQSIGINPEFLEKFNIDENKVNEPFRAKNKIELISGVKRTISILYIEDIIDKLTWNTYREWSGSCEKNKIELNSIASYNLIEDPIRSKMYDIVDCIVEILEDPDLPWNITRVRQMDKFEKQRYSGRYIWTIKTKLPEVSVLPDIILEFAEKDIVKDKIDEEHKDYLDILTEIGDLMTTNIENIEGKLENLEEAENDVITNITKEIEKEYPNIFEELDWTEILQDKYPNKVDKLNNLIKVSGQEIRINNIGEYIKLTKQLKSHKGSIKGNAPEKAITAKEKELQIYTKKNLARKNAFKRREKFNRHLQLILRRTDEYKEVKADITKLEEELENREVEEDEREGILKEFKDKLEKIFEDLLKELEKFEVEEEEIEEEDIFELEDE